MYSFCAMYSLRMSFWMVPEIFFQSAPCFSATTRYMAHSTEAGELMVMETVVFSVNAGEEGFHVLERINGHAALAHFAFAAGMVGVIAHQCGQVEGHRKAASAVLQQVLVAQVGFLRGSEAGKLAHGPKLAAVAGGMNAPGEGLLAGIAQIFFVRPVFRQV